MRTAALLLTVLVHPLFASANDWPSWRGPNGDGKLSESASYPVEWSPDGIAWRATLPAPGNSSPVVANDRVFLTMAEEEGAVRSLLCFDAENGEILWKRSAAYGKKDPTHKTNPFSAASPVTDGETVYVWQGNAGLFAYDLEGNERWRTDLGNDYAHQWGANAASPVLVGDSLVVHTGPGMATRLVSVNRKDGSIAWQEDLEEAASRDIKEYKGSWATPLAWENGDSTELLLGLPGFLASFDSATGEETWRVGGLGDLCYTNVLVGGGRAVYLGGFGGPGIGVRVPAESETGDLTESHRLWADPPKGKNQNPQRIGSGQIVGDYLYLLNEPGVIQCLEVATGKSRWRDRLGKKSWSSMNYVGGKLYVNDMLATTYVIDPDPEKLSLVATNQVGDRLHTNASLAFADGRIFLRTDTTLFAIGP